MQHDRSEVPPGPDGPSPPAPAAETPAPPGGPPAGHPRRPQKLVVTLQPLPATVGDGYRALLAFGSDGCDPVLAVAEVDGILAAVAAVPALVAGAEERWRAQPRN